MILLFRLVILIILFMNFRIRSNKLNMNFVFKIFIEIKRIRVFLVKLISGIILFLFLNYNRYMYYSVGLRINYGYVFIYAFRLVLML
jgi:hypothetical protein